MEQHLAQSTNGRPIEEDAHTVDDSDLMLSYCVGRCHATLWEFLFMSS